MTALTTYDESLKSDKHFELHTSSYKLTRGAARSCSPNQRTPAVIPLPQLVITGLSPLTTFPAISVPTALFNASRTSDSGRNVVYSGPALGLCFWRNKLKGSEWEFGIWPEGSPGRGSGSSPVYLDSCEETKDTVIVIRTFHEILHRELFLISMKSDWNLLPFVRNLFKC